MVNNKSSVNHKTTTRKIIFLLASFFCLTPFVSPPIALLLGLLISQFIGNPYLDFNHKIINILLQVSVVGLGFGMNLSNAIKIGKQGFYFTLISIFLTLIIGFILSKLMKIDKKTSYLISVGTAICGGSAIAAISPIVKAEERQIYVALGIVFVLNSVALFVFPMIGHAFKLTSEQFGLWCAIAIHDTSSVVGAASKYSQSALDIATTVKLTRALWIIPLAIFTALIFKNKNTKIKIPFFILFFVLAIVMNTYFQPIQKYSHYIVRFSKIGLTFTLFLIGSSLSFVKLKSIGVKPFIQGFLLWIFVVAISLIVIFLKF